MPHCGEGFFLGDLSVSLQVDGIFVVAYQVDVENKQAAGDEIVSENYKLHDQFYDPHIAADHVVADPAAERGYAEPDRGKHDEFNKSAFVFSHIAVFENENR